MEVSTRSAEAPNAPARPAAAPSAASSSATQQLCGSSSGKAASRSQGVSLGYPTNNMTMPLTNHRSISTHPAMPVHRCARYIRRLAFEATLIGPLLLSRSGSGPRLETMVQGQLETPPRAVQPLRRCVVGGGVIGFVEHVV